MRTIQSEFKYLISFSTFLCAFWLLILDSKLLTLDFKLYSAFYFAAVNAVAWGQQRPYKSLDILDLAMPFRLQNNGRSVGGYQVLKAVSASWGVIETIHWLRGQWALIFPPKLSKFKVII